VVYFYHYESMTGVSWLIQFIYIASFFEANPN